MFFLNQRKYFFHKKFSFILLVIISFFSYASLSATTVQTIQGHPPKLNVILETEITNQNFSLLGIDIAGTQYYSGSTITINTPGITKFNELVPIIKTLSTGEAIDSDGDNTFNLSPISTNSLAIEIRDSTNTIISIADHNKTICDLVASYSYPYKLNVVGDLKLTTQYGAPNVQHYTAIQGVNTQPKSADINLNVIGVCYAKPNLNYDFLSVTNDVWDPNKGFKLQSTTQPDKNFPTTGFNNAFFELKTIGIDAQTLSFSPITQGNVTATMSATAADTIKVTLSGPSYNTPAPFIGPGVLEIKDSSNTINYSFNINQWVIANPNVMANFNTAKTYCDTLAGGTYQLPTRAQYTNSNLAGGASPGNYYVREIGEGILPEWGALYFSGNQYPNTDWNISSPPYPTYKSYWSIDNHSLNRQYDIGASGGSIGDNDISATIFYAACINQ